MEGREGEQWIGLGGAEKHRLAAPRTPISINGSRYVSSGRQLPASASSYGCSGRYRPATPPSPVICMAVESYQVSHMSLLGLQSSDSGLRIVTNPSESPHGNIEKFNERQHRWVKLWHLRSSILDTVDADYLVEYL